MSNFVSNDNATSLFTKLSQSLGKRPKTWTGTRAAWDQMTTEQKAVYDGWYVNFTDDAEEGGGGAGGGHIIEDSEGTELTQRDTLKVGGSLIAEDDSTNEKTIITDGMQTIDWEDWLEMTDEEKAAVPKALITNVPGLDSKLNVQFMKKLWENPSPTMAFAAQNITLSSDDYDFLLIEAKRIKSDTSYFSEIVEKGKSIYLSASFGQSGGATNYFRVITYSSDTSLYVDNGYKVTGATASTSDNDCVIPYQIYGFKASVDVDITAYMADLETDAKNVYLESGESVEDEINRVTATTIDWGNRVSINASTEYTTLADGYVFFNGIANATIRLDVDNVPLMQAVNASPSNIYSLYVRKGAKIKSINSSCIFVPYNN